MRKQIDEVQEHRYFDYSEVVEVDSIEFLLELNEPKHIAPPGYDPLDVSSVSFANTYRTAGLFRGQLKNWPLGPQAYRQVSVGDDPSEQFYKLGKYHFAMSDFEDYCEMAERQIPGFPANEVDRMTIAQHFGISTALLDWTTNIFVALFFAVDQVFNVDEKDMDGEVYLYHVPDERVLENGRPGPTELYEFEKTTLVRPFHVDRRVERQFSVFTFHPVPGIQKARAVVNVYKITWPLVQRARRLMSGLGYTYDHYFPDYSGIADALKVQLRLGKSVV